jgi:hypothetical protein
MSQPVGNNQNDRQTQLNSLVGDMFREGGWKVLEQPEFENGNLDMIAKHAGKTYLIEIKRSSEGRRDRVIPLLAQAILEVRNAVHRVSGHPIGVAIVGADYIPASLVEQVKRFAKEYARDIAVGILDDQGLRSFEGHGLKRFDSQPAENQNSHLLSRSSLSPQLFSDLNQWMLKVLLAPRIPEAYLAAPRGHYQGASHLARAAGVSIMSAFRLVQQLTKEGFLESGREGLRLVRKQELMNQWSAANQRSVPEIAARWILHRGKNALGDALRSYVSPTRESPRLPRKSEQEKIPARRPRACLGLFAAAEAMGLGFVHGVRPYLYIESLQRGAVASLGLSTHDSDQHPDVYIRIPRNRETVFRGVVLQDGRPACDILQVWLEVAHHPSRGREQADLIWSKILAPALLDKDE